jgi:hypothetical protein
VTRATADPTTAVTTRQQVSNSPALQPAFCHVSFPIRFAASDRNAVAYAATRLVPCHAAVSRALMHVKQMLPRFAPKSIMDFGAGPGTATMAAASLFSASAAAFTLVEPSIAMQVTRDCCHTHVTRLTDLQGVCKTMLAGLSTVTYLPSLSHAPTKTGVAHHPKPQVPNRYSVPKPPPAP